MKHITSIILAAALLAGMTACNTTPVGSDAPIAPPETVETTAPVTETTETTAPVTEAPLDIPSLLEGYTLHELSSDELESFREGFPKDSALGNVAVKVTDYDELYLLIEDKGVIDGDAYERANVRRVICGDTVQDCDITFVFGPSSFGLLKTDEYTVVSHCWYFSYHYIFHDDGCTYIPTDYGRDGASVWLSVEDDKLCYKLENPIITNTFGDYGKILEKVTSEDEWRYEWGTVSLDGDRVVLSKTKEQTMGDDNFLRGIFSYGSEFDTLEELLEYNKLKAEVGEAEALLSTIPVYEYSYKDSKHLDELDKIGAAEYAKYAAGEEFDEYYAIKFTEYPDIAIIGQVNKEPEKNDYDAKYGINSVIWNGERHYTPEYNAGPSFRAEITEDFICIVEAASAIGAGYYVYSGGAEYYKASDIVNEGVYGNLYESNGTMIYKIYSRKYNGLRHSFSPLMNNVDPDDHMYDCGTVQLVDGKIKYVADESYTVGEWYASAKDYREKSGCETVEEFSAWLREYEESEAWETDTEPLWLP